MLFLLTLLFVLIKPFYTIVLVHTTFNTTRIYNDEEAEFGPDLFEADIKGKLFKVEPLDACKKVQPPPSGFTRNESIALIERGQNCTFEDKVFNVQTDYIAAIIYDNIEEGLIRMGGSGKYEVVIPSVLVTRYDGSKLKQLIAQEKIDFIMIKSNGSKSFMYYLLPFIVFLFILLLTLLGFIIVRCVQNYLKKRKRALSRYHLRKLEEITFKKSVHTYETCAICLDDFSDGDKLRILPCKHGYHCKCIDPWLLKERRVCPVCKHIIRFGNEHLDAEDLDAEQEEDYDEGARNIRRPRLPSGETTPSVVVRSVGVSPGTSAEETDRGLLHRITSSIARLRQRSNDGWLSGSLERDTDRQPLVNEDEAPEHHLPTSHSEADEEEESPKVDGKDHPQATASQQQQNASNYSNGGAENVAFNSPDENAATDTGGASQQQPTASSAAEVAAYSPPPTSDPKAIPPTAKNV